MQHNNMAFWRTVAWLLISMGRGRTGRGGTCMNLDSFVLEAFVAQTNIGSIAGVGLLEMHKKRERRGIKGDQDKPPVFGGLVWSKRAVATEGSSSGVTSTVTVNDSIRYITFVPVVVHV